MPRDDNSNRLRKNVYLGNRRTSVSLEHQVWDGLIEICRREQISLDALCTAVDDLRVASSMSSALRVFVLTYFRELAENASPRSRQRIRRPAVQPTGASGVLPGTFGRFRRDQDNAANG